LLVVILVYIFATHLDSPLVNSPPAQDFPIRMNDLIAGRYQVMDFLGAAAFSRAVQALDIKTNTLVCLKIVKVVESRREIDTVVG